MFKNSDDSAVKDTIDAAVECALACRRCAAACLEEKNIDMLRECIRLDRDCAWICDLTTSYLLGNSAFEAQACQLCAEICDACAMECGKHSDMQHCVECAQACRECADACRTLVGAMA